MIKKIGILVLICVVPVIFYLLSLENVVPIPNDDNHSGIVEDIRCFECHGEGKEYARSKEHPPKDRCFKCHILKKD